MTSRRATNQKEGPIMPAGYWTVDHADSDADPHWLFRQRGFKKLCGWNVAGGVAMQSLPAGVPYDLDAEALDQLIERLTERRDQLRREAEAAPRPGPVLRNNTAF